MKVTTHNHDTIKVLSVEGAMNAKTSNLVEVRLNKLIMGGNQKLIVNLEKLNYISSSGLRVLLAADKLIKKKKGSLRICNLNDTIREVFKISGFDMIFNVFSNEAEALTDF